jgi:hypothetical protein
LKAAHMLKVSFQTILHEIAISKLSPFFLTSWALGRFHA